MRDAQVKKLSISDLMILVAAIGVGLGGWSGHQAVYRWSTVPRDLADWVVMVSSLCLALSWALIAIQVRSTRSAWRRLGRQPGFVACLAVALSSLVKFVLDLLISRQSIAYPSTWLGFVHLFVKSAWPFSIAPGIVVGWATLTMGGRLRTKSDWIDRLGVALGMFWVVAAIVLAWVSW